MALMSREAREERDRDIVRRYRSGEKVEDIVKTASGSYSAVYSALKKAGIESRRPETTVSPSISPSKQQREERDREIVRRYRSGEKVKDIVEQVTGGSFESVYRALHRQNVPLRYIKPSDIPFYLSQIVPVLTEAVILEDWQRVKRAISNLEELLPGKNPPTS
jgi:Mor family transcriptional regulator